MHKLLLALTCITIAISPVNASTTFDHKFMTLPVEPVETHQLHIGYYEKGTLNAQWYPEYFPATSTDDCEAIGTEIIAGRRDYSKTVLSVIKGTDFIMYCMDAATGKPVTVMSADLEEESPTLNVDDWVEPVSQKK